jgi:hypothetical protein
MTCYSMGLGETIYRNKIIKSAILAPIFCRRDYISDIA